MTRPTLPIYCARCHDGTLAAWEVVAPPPPARQLRGEVVCGPHLTASQTWARTVGEVSVTPVAQPDGAELRAAPGDDQHTLFDNGSRS
jgi:hypothetical protein